MIFKYYIITFCLLSLSNISTAQTHPYQVKFSHEIESGLADKTLKTYRAGLLYSLISEYQLSNTYSDIPVSWGVDSLSFDSYLLADALPYIVSEAEKHQVIIISENHLKPQHRIFAKKVINALSKIGFSHLGLETFSSSDNKNELIDEELINRGYPMNSQLTGTYTMEPRMGELVRDAIRHNYNLFAYERSKKIKGIDRDQIQADNVIRYLEKHPNEKIIILCGFHHAIESDLLKYGKYKWMASHIKEKTGINPLTVYQDNFTEKFIENEHPILRQLNITKPSIFTNQNGSLVQITDHVDVEVIHPKTVYRNGRPNWLFEDEDYRSVKVRKDVESLQFPIIASAFLTGEVGSVPVDRIEIKHKYDNKPLVLKSGKYRINLSDGKNEFDYEILVEKKSD